MSDELEGAVYHDPHTDSIVMNIAGLETRIPAEHAEEVHELLGEYLEEEGEDE